MKQLNVNGIDNIRISLEIQTGSIRISHDQGFDSRYSETKEVDLRLACTSGSSSTINITLEYQSSLPDIKIKFIGRNILTGQDVVIVENTYPNSVEKYGDTYVLKF